MMLIILLLCIDEGPPGYNGVMSEDGGSPRPDPNTMDADMPAGNF